MAKELVSDDLWRLVEPLLPKVERRYRFPGRRRIDDRKVLTGILFVLQTGIPWEYLPQEMGCGSGMTCWRRLREWQGAGGGERGVPWRLEGGGKGGGPRGPARAAPARHPGEDRLAEERPRLRAGEEAVGDRAHDRLAAPTPSPARPL